MQNDLPCHERYPGFLDLDAGQYLTLVQYESSTRPLLQIIEVWSAYLQWLRQMHYEDDSRLKLKQN